MIDEATISNKIFDNTLLDTHARLFTIQTPSTKPYQSITQPKETVSSPAADPQPQIEPPIDENREIVEKFDPFKEHLDSAPFMSEGVMIWAVSGVGFNPDGTQIVFGRAGFDGVADSENIIITGNMKLGGNFMPSKITGGDVADILYGNKGSDSIYGRDGDDLIHGGDNSDRLFGGNGDDLLHGGEGHDRVNGGDGNDLIKGGAGNDLLTGGDGADLFQFDMSDIIGLESAYALAEENEALHITPAEELITMENIDIITDFDIDNDQLDLSNLLSDFDGDITSIDKFVQMTETAGGDTMISVDPNGTGDFVDMNSQVIMLNGINGLGTVQDMVESQQLIIT